MSVLLEAEGLVKRYEPDTVAVNDASFALQEGETLAVLGPSGCGKSTLLRLIAGLEIQDQGDVRFQGRSLTGVPPQERQFGLMFQDLALFPHLDVFENVAFGLRMRRWGDEAVQERVRELLAFMHIPDFTHRRVDTLSGGEQQRVALARSLAPRPRLLMLDEPLGSLDRALREDLLQETRRVLQETGVTALYVTHDQDEAFAIADRVLIMERGRPVQDGTPEEVYLSPTSPFVAHFLGHRNLVSCQASRKSDGVMVDSSLGGWLLPGVERANDMPPRSTILIPPEAVSLHTLSEGEIAGTVGEINFQGGRYYVQVTLDGGLMLTAEVPLTAIGGDRLNTGQQVTVTIDVSKVRLLPWSLSGETA